MPKQNQQSYAKPRSTYVHPSLSGAKIARPCCSPSQPPSATVNERLTHLRRAHAPPSSLATREHFVTAATQRSVPPDLRGILNIPEPVQPRPKPGSRSNVGRRGPPGPPAPKSWTLPGKGVQRSVQEPRTAHTSLRPNTLDALPGVRVPAPGSLLHMTLKSLTVDWDWQVEYYQHYLGALPPWLKSLLLSYVAIYGSGVTLAQLRVLCQAKDEIEGGTRTEELHRLDLSGSVRHSSTKRKHLTLNELRHYMTSGPASGPTQPSLTAVESWEDEADSLVTLSLQPLEGSARFRNLTHLSLSHPGKLVSWSALLSLSAHLDLITHLSLAYWPRPTVTPNSLTASMVSTRHPAGSVSLGGSNYYSAMDGDWHEAADILRRLSKNTYSLKWLDLEGCGEWFAALRWTRDSCSSHRPLAQGSNDARPGYEVGGFSEFSQGPDGPQWNNAWRHLEYVNLYQGWLPQDIGAIQNVESGRLAMQLLQFLQYSQGLQAGRDISSSIGDCDPHCLELHKSRWATPSQPGDTSSTGSYVDPIHARNQVRMWLRTEAEARGVESFVRTQRTHAKGLFCAFDHGWLPALPT